jgi:Flp pilus assembly protein TadG
MVLGIIEVGRALQLRNELAYAADRAIRQAYINRTISDGDLAAALRGELSMAQPGKVTVLVGQEKVGSTDYRTITASYPMTLLIPGLSKSAITLSIARKVPKV